jgi:hypothetical protein
MPDFDEVLAPVEERFCTYGICEDYCVALRTQEGEGISYFLMYSAIVVENANQWLLRSSTSASDMGAGVPLP